MVINERCMACGSCANICPVGAISISENNEGFYKSVVDETLCIRCGLCKEHCPELLPCENSNNPLCYAVWASDEIRYLSTSGGAFTVFAEEIIRNEGIVYGCAWDEDFNAVHIRISEEEEISRLRKSKYVQCRMDDSYKRAKKDLEDGKKVLFTGLPCHIAGLCKYLERKYENLYTMDLVCAGAPSVSVWKKYLRELENEKGKIKSVEFRPKHLGWSRYFELLLHLDNGDTIENHNDMYMQAFYKGITKNLVCGNCNYSEFPRYADITIGDLWHIKQINPQLDDNKGTSVVVMNSEKGINLFNSVKNKFKLCEVVDINFIKTHNSFSKKKVIHPKRDEFFEYFTEKNSFKYAMEKIRKKSCDICVIGNWSGYNYGAHLTHYALYQALTDMDYDVLMVEKVDEEPYRPLEKPELFKCNPYPKHAISNLYPTLSSMKELNECCETFIVGSDQLWNYELFGHGMECYTLSFVNSDKKKISYATSFGGNNYIAPIDFKKKFNFLINRFDSVSVREKSGVSLLEDMNVNATCVIDPVFLPNIEHYFNMIDKSEIVLPDDKYIFSYIIYPSEEKERILRKIADEYNLKIVCVGDALSKGKYNSWGVDIYENCYVEDWLKLIYNSSLVVADSFHAYCFSLIFNKQIVSCAAYGRTSDRMRSLSDKLNLNNIYLAKQLVDDEAERILEKTYINYEQVSKEIDDFTEYSREWLKKAIKAEKNNKNQAFDVFWDAYGTEIIEYKKDIKRIDSIQKRNQIESEMRGTTVIVFGMGKKFEENFETICSITDVSFVCDNDKKKWGKTTQNGIRCVSVEELKKIESPFVIVCIDSAYDFKAIKRQLFEIGIKNVIQFNEFLCIYDK